MRLLTIADELTFPRAKAKLHANCVLLFVRPITEHMIILLFHLLVF